MMFLLFLFLFIVKYEKNRQFIGTSGNTLQVGEHQKSLENNDSGRDILSPSANDSRFTRKTRPKPLSFGNSRHLRHSSSESAVTWGPILSFSLLTPNQAYLSIFLDISIYSTPFWRKFKKIKKDTPFVSSLHVKDPTLSRGAACTQHCLLGVAVPDIINKLALSIRISLIYFVFVVLICFTSFPFRVYPLL